MPVLNFLSNEQLKTQRYEFETVEDLNARTIVYLEAIIILIIIINYSLCITYLKCIFSLFEHQCFCLSTFCTTLFLFIK